MSLDPKKAKKIQRKLVDEGLQPARCFAIIDIGSHYKTFKGAKSENSTQQVMLCFEFTKFMHKFGEDKPAEPLCIFNEYTFSAGDKAKLPKVLKSWGKIKAAITQINLRPFLGQYCHINVEHTEGKDGTTYANIGAKGLSINPYMKEVGPVPKKFHKDVFFDLDYFDWNNFNSLPKRAQKRIRECEEWNGIISKHPEPIQENEAPVNQIDDAGFEQDEDAPAF